MTLTVRLGPGLESALERHCAEHGTTKSHVVQECLATYLVTFDPTARKPSAAPGAAFVAFEAAGFLGGSALGPESADKAAVRRRVVGMKG